jgi:hypothetical protein
VYTRRDSREAVEAVKASFRRWAIRRFGTESGGSPFSTPHKRRSVQARSVMADVCAACDQSLGNGVRQQLFV